MTDQPDFIGRFPVVSTLGVGGMGVVYLAKDPDIGRSVAIKVLHANRFQADLGRFKNEARTIGELSHPNIVVLLEYGIDDGSPFLVMEYLEGESLEKWIGTPHTLGEHKTILVDLCNALDFAHSKDILHRDLKPGNVQVLPSGQAKLLDFGIARSNDSDLTVTGVVMGTPKYVAPESLETGKHTKTSDCYSLGLLAYTMLSGSNPFAAPTYDAAIMKQFTLQPPLLHELNAAIPVKLSKTIAAYLNKNPDERPDSPTQLKDALALLVSPKLLTKTIDTQKPAKEPSSIAATVQFSRQSAPSSPASSNKSSLLIWGSGIALLTAGLGIWGLWDLVFEKPALPQPAETIATPPPRSHPINQPITENRSPSVAKPRQEVITTPTPAQTIPEKKTEPLAKDAATISATASTISAPGGESATPTATITQNKPATTNASTEKLSPAPALSKKQAKVAAKKPTPAPEKPSTNKPASPKKTASHTDKKVADKTAAKQKPKKKTAKPVSTSTLAASQQRPAPPPKKRTVVTLPGFSSISSSNTLTALNNPHLLRGQTTKVLIKAPDIAKIADFQIYYGRKKTTKLSIRRINKTKNNLVEVSVYVDQNAILGSYSLYGLYSNGNKTRPLFLEVSL